MTTETWYLPFNDKKKILFAPFLAEAPHIAGLKRAIKEDAFSDQKNVKAASLVVWRCKEPLLSTQDEDELQEHLSKIDFLDEEQVIELASGVDLADLELGSKEVLLVEVPAPEQDGEECEFAYYKAAKTSKLSMITPGYLNAYSNYKSLQNYLLEKIMDDIPEPDLNIPPLPLLYHGFGRFYDYITCVVKEQMPAGALKQLVDNFITSVCELEPKEEKQDWIQEILLKILFPLKKIRFQRELQASHTTFDGYVVAKHGGPMLVVEFKRDFAPAEPQMAGDFLQLALQARKDITLAWCQPCLGIIIRGQSISFHALVMLDSQVRSLPITNAFLCNDSELQDRGPLYAAFMAAQTLLGDIDHDAEHYASSALPPIPQEKRRFPNVGGLYLYPSSDKKKRLEFQISRSLSENVKGSFVYVALTSDPNPKEIVVKFTRKYGEELHKFCAGRGYAPKLLAYERLAGDWIGVAMEFVASACHLTESKFSRECGQQWLDKMDQMVAEIHEAGYVHGDLRPPNFIVDRKKLLLIDFDWGGEEGKATFPDIALLPILRKDRNDVMITKADDDRVLQHTKQELRGYFNLK